MFDADAISPVLQRTRGSATVHLAPARTGGTATARLLRLHQSGSAKAMLPRMHGGVAEVVFLNTAGGITGGDRLDYALDLEAGTQAVATTQTAERAYRSAGGAGRVNTRLKLGAGAVLHWLPQEVIVFDGSAMVRDLSVDMAADATLICLETLLLGRAAMGETVRHLHLRDTRQVRRGGRLVMLEALRLDDADLARPGAAGLQGVRAVASLTLIARDAADRLARLRAVLPDFAAASAWGGRLTARFVAQDAYALRQAVVRAVEALTAKPVPRVWQI